MTRRLSLVLGLLVLLAPNLSQAQTKDALTKTLAAATCDCLQQKQADLGKTALTKESAKTIIIQCSGVSVGKNLKAVQAVYGTKAIETTSVMNQLGREIGADMIQSCPTFMTYSLAMVGGGEPAASTAATTGQTTGEWGSVSGAGVATLGLNVSKTDKAEFVWSRHFPKDDELLAQLDKLKGRRVRVSWEEVEVFQPETKQYRKQRQITGVDLL
ncbi:MAG: hypothetical protein JWR44_2381 [Hymenobacter sp.]|nr:hypothetical protein [Hymenobacter sp.]